jgi:hypothetical protein
MDVFRGHMDRITGIEIAVGLGGLAALVFATEQAGESRRNSGNNSNNNQARNGRATTGARDLPRDVSGVGAGAERRQSVQRSSWTLAAGNSVRPRSLLESTWILRERDFSFFLMQWWIKPHSLSGWWVRQALKLSSGMSTVVATTDYRYESRTEAHCLALWAPTLDSGREITKK